MKAISADLLTSVGTSYDKTRTTRFGNVITQTVSGKQVISPPLIKFIDTLSDFGVVPLHAYASANGRIFVTTTAPSGSLVTLVAYTFDYTTGAFTAIGGIKYQLTNTNTHTIRQIKVFDPGTSGWKIMISTLNTTAANGGLYMVNAVALSDFVLVSFPTIPLATTGDTQASKKVFFLQETGGTNLLTVAQGHAISTADNKVYVGNNAVATFQIYKFDPYATISSVTAAGVTSDCFVLKTGNVGTPAGLLGTILLLNSFDIGTPADGPNAGFECMYVPGSTGFNEFRTSDITSGATSLPTLRTCNVLDAPSVSSAITPATANWSDSLNRIVFQATGRTIVKPFANNLYELSVGYNTIQYRTGVSNLVNELSSITVSSGEMRNGWVFYTCASASQQGVVGLDLRSDQMYDYSYFITKVMDTTNAQWVALRVNNRLRGNANPLKIYYRAAATATDSIFNSASGGWTALANDYDMTAIASSNFIQFKGAYYSNLNPTAIYAQPSEIRLIYQPNNEISDNWVGSVDNTVTGSPSRSAFRLMRAYTSLVPKLYFRAYDDSNVLVASANTVDDAAFFEYSTNNGSSWNPLGTIPNTALTTELRYNWASPPGVKVTVSIRES